MNAPLKSHDLRRRATPATMNAKTREKALARIANVERLAGSAVLGSPTCPESKHEQDEKSLSGADQGSAGARLPVK